MINTFIPPSIIFPFLSFLYYTKFHIIQSKYLKMFSHYQDLPDICCLLLNFPIQFLSFVVHVSSDHIFWASEQYHFKVCFLFFFDNIVFWWWRWTRLHLKIDNICLFLQNSRSKLFWTLDLLNFLMFWVLFRCVYVFVYSTLRF